MKFQRKTLARLLALALGSAGAGEALAATRYFDCASGNMQTASCWSSNIKPVAGDNAYIGYSLYPSAVTATLNSGSFAATNEFVGSGYTASYNLYKGTVNHSAGSNTVSNGLYVGYHQSGDWATGSWSSTYDAGVYNLSGTGSLATTNTVVGYNSWGAFSQSGGTHTVSNNLSLGVGGEGAYQIAGGMLSVNGSIISGAAYNQLRITGGIVNAGSVATSNAGYIDIIGGALNVVGSITGGNGSLSVGGAGTLNVGGGNGSIDVGSFTVNSSYTLSGSGSIKTASSTIGSWGAGVFTQTGGSHTAQQLDIGWQGGTGTYTQTGGGNTVDVLTVSRDGGGASTYNLSGNGILKTTTACVGCDGLGGSYYGVSGSFNQSGGTHTASKLVVGYSDPSLFNYVYGGYSSGTYTLSNGVLTAGTVFVGQNRATGIFTQSGGTHSVNQLFLGDNEGIAGNGGNGSYNLQGGMLNAGTIDMLRGGTAAFNFTGGTLAVGTFIGNLANNGGILAPGASPGMTTIQGNYTQAANGTMAMELGGAGAGMFDTLAVTGTATLGGTLGVSLWNGYNPTAGDSFNLISAQNLLGNFDNYNFVALGEGLTWHVDLLHDQDVLGTDYLRLSVASVPVPAAVWLLGSGLLGLLGVARRRKMAA